MPYRARRNNNNGPEVHASRVTINERNDFFYCMTPGCDAVMKVVNVGNVEKAYFRRLPTYPHHSSANCVRHGITFDKTKYDESKFTMHGFAEWIFAKPNLGHKGHTRTTTRKEGGRSIGFRTLGKVYEMCVALGKMETYNGVLIDDIFADEENYARYSNNLNDLLIVECSFFKKVYRESSLLFNYSTNFRNPHIVVKVNFEDEEMCWKYYYKFKGCHHTEPIAVVGIWRPTNGTSEARFECDFVSSRQIYIVK